MNEIKKPKEQSNPAMSRGHFISTTAAAAAAFTMLPTCAIKYSYPYSPD